MNGKDDTSTGGAIIFITDGDQSCDRHDELKLTDKKVLQRVINTKVRIITVAFRFVNCSQTYVELKYRSFEI